MIDKFDESEQLRKKAHALIPGGSHTYAKGDDGHLRYEFHGQAVCYLESPEKIVLIHIA